MFQGGKGYGVQLQGKDYTLEYRAYITDSQHQVISPFHDIPIGLSQQTKTVTVVNEIPRFTNAKREINKEEKYNPIKIDEKKGKVRFVTSIFPKKGYIWNYGAIPQTWESPEKEDTRTRYKGDNDPIDAIEIGEAVIETGCVYKAKIIGAIAMIDSGECDWKVIVIREGDVNYDRVSSIKDIEEHMPGLLEETREWFRNYKVPDGSPLNKFALEEKYLDAEEAVEIVKETHAHWRELISREHQKGISLVNATQKETPGYTQESYRPKEVPYEGGLEPLSGQRFYFMK